MSALTPEEAYITRVVQEETKRLQNRVEWLEKDIKSLRDALTDLIDVMSK